MKKLSVSILSSVLIFGWGISSIAADAGKGKISIDLKTINSDPKNPGILYPMLADWQRMLTHTTGCYFDAKSHDSESSISLQIGMKGNNSEESVAMIQIINPPNIPTVKTPRVSYSTTGVAFNADDNHPQNVTAFAIINGGGGLSYFPMDKSSQCKVDLTLKESHLMGSVHCDGLVNPKDDPTESITIDTKDFVCVPAPPEHE